MDHSDEIRPMESGARATRPELGGMPAEDGRRRRPPAGPALSS